MKENKIRKKQANKNSQYGKKSKLPKILRFTHSLRGCFFGSDYLVVVANSLTGKM